MGGRQAADHDVPANPVDTAKAWRRTLSKSVSGLVAAAYAKAVNPTGDTATSNPGAAYSAYFMAQR